MERRRFAGTILAGTVRAVGNLLDKSCRMSTGTKSAEAERLCWRKVRQWNSMFTAGHATLEAMQAKGTRATVVRGCD